MIQEQRQKDADVSRRYTLDIRRRTSHDGDDDASLSDEDEASVVEISEAEQIRTAFLRLCIINEVLGSIEWVRTRHMIAIILLYLPSSAFLRE